MAVRPAERAARRATDGARPTGPRLRLRRPLPHPTSESRRTAPARSPWQRVPYFWFILPALIAYGVLFLYPTIRAFYLSFFDWTGVGPIGDFIGFDNFRELLHSDRFWSAALNSSQLFIFIFIFQNTVSLGLALMLNRRSRMTHIYRAIIFLPVRSCRRSRPASSGS